MLLLFCMGQPPSALIAELEDLVEDIFVPKVVAETVRCEDEDVVCEDREGECMWLHREG